MTLPKYTPYLNGDGGVKIGLSPISELEWLDIDHKFEEEISLKNKVELFIDGSADLQSKTAGIGGVIFINQEKFKFFFRVHA